MLAGLPMLRQIAEIEARRFRMVGSANLTLVDVLELAAEIDRLAAAGVDGVVVTQGTDTLEETSYALDLLLRPGMPVVVTGAMRNPGLPGEDGPANLVAAVRLAASVEAAGLGVLVALDDTIHLARFVRKTHATATGAFTSARVGPVGYTVEDRVRLLLQPRHPSPHFAVAPGAELPDVALLTLSLGNDERLIDSVVPAGYRELVVEAFGAGHVAERTLQRLEQLARQMPVVFATRTGSGELFRSTGSYPGSEGDLVTRGLIPAVGLDGRKARILLTLLLATGTSRPEMASVFESASL